MDQPSRGNVMWMGMTLIYSAHSSRIACAMVSAFGTTAASSVGL
jgi:hypothetical protein